MTDQNHLFQMNEEGAQASPAGKCLDSLWELVFSPALPAAPPQAIQQNPKRLELYQALLEIRKFTQTMASGDLSASLKTKGFLAGTLKALHASLRHMTWQAQQIAHGDFSQRIEFMGEFANAFNTMAYRLDLTMKQLKLREEEMAQRVRELETALSQIKQLHGLLPICAYCKKVRDDKNYWHQVENYVADHSDAHFSHGVCPDCLEKALKDEFWKSPPKEGSTPPGNG